MDQRDLHTEIKKIIKSCMQNENLSDIMYATYTENGLKIDNKPVEIGFDMVDIPKHLTEITGEISFTVNKDSINADGEKILQSSPEIDSITIHKMPIVIQAELQAGDRVAVAMKKGAQRYTILDKI